MFEVLYIDTHCHLYFDRFDKDRHEVLRRASDGDVGRILVPGIDQHTSDLAVDLAERYESLYAGIGVHPNSALSWTDETRDRFRRLAVHERVVAMGEIGLDYYWDSAPKEIQHQVFIDQLELAEEYELPVVIHVRDRDQERTPALCDVLDILREWISGLEQINSPLAAHPGVLHSYSGNLELAQEAHRLGMSIGVTGPVTFKNADQLREVVVNMPLKVLLTETDAPFLTPHPFRGKRNEPAYVRYVTDEIARLRCEEVVYVREQIEKNAQRLFHW